MKFAFQVKMGVLFALRLIPNTCQLSRQGSFSIITFKTSSDSLPDTHLSRLSLAARLLSDSIQFMNHELIRVYISG